MPGYLRFVDGRPFLLRIAAGLAEERGPAMTPNAVGHVCPARRPSCLCVLYYSVSCMVLRRIGAIAEPRAVPEPPLRGQFGAAGAASPETDKVVLGGMYPSVADSSGMYPFAACPAAPPGLQCSGKACMGRA